jgi:23S rRNA (pseudouridine1915-N3)-methyltransferase
MKIRLISIGRTEDDFIRMGTDRYLKLIRVYCPFEEIRIKGVKLISDKEVQKALNQEAEKILKQIDPRDNVILLDRKGKMMDSVSLASFLEEGLKSPSRSITFLIGSADGVAQSLRERADNVLSLSQMTFTHELSRLLLLEQIYRAFTILKGKRYHR